MIDGHQRAKGQTSMTNTYFVAPQIVPPASVKLGDLRKPILNLPSFTTPHWFAKNIFFSKAASILQARNRSDELLLYRRRERS